MTIVYRSEGAPEAPEEKQKLKKFWNMARVDISQTKERQKSSNVRFHYRKKLLLEE